MDRCDLKKWGGCWITNRSGWLLELLTELTNEIERSVQCRENFFTWQLFSLVCNALIFCIQDIADVLDLRTNVIFLHYSAAALHILAFKVLI